MSAEVIQAKRRELLAAYTTQYWRERKQLRAEDALRAVDALWRQVKLSSPDWSIPEDREADLQMHIRISAVLARTAPSWTKARTMPTRGASHRAGAPRRRAR